MSDDNVVASTRKAMLLLAEHFSFSGDLLGEDWMLKQAGFVDASPEGPINSDAVVQVRHARTGWRTATLTRGRTVSEVPFTVRARAGQGSSRKRGLAEARDGGAPRQQRGQEAVPRCAVQVPGVPRRRPGGRVPDDGGVAEPLARGVARRRRHGHGHVPRRVLGARPAAEAVPGPRPAGAAPGPRRRVAPQLQQDPR